MLLSRWIKKAVLITLVFIGVATNVWAQPKYTVSGYIKDSLTGETLIGASLLAKNAGASVASNQYGYYSITLPKGKYNFACTFLGYNAKEFTLDIQENSSLNVLLTPASTQIKEVIVSSTKKQNNVKDAQMGKVELSVSNIKALPAFLGEVDILKTLQLMPGVRNAGEGNAGFYVRGGGPDQNLMLLDDAVVYNPGHLFGFFSVFNADAIKSVSLIKGGMPAQYGSRLSSVVDISMKDGNINDYNVDAGIGLISSRLSVQGPIKKTKSSFILSSRRTYIDVLTKPFIPKDAAFNGGYFFYDVNAKMNFILSPKDKLFLSGYFGRDNFYFENKKGSGFKTNIPWGNATATVRWNHVFNQKLFANTTLIYNDYKFSLEGGQSNFSIKFSSGITDVGAKIDFDWFANNQHKVKFGFQHTYHTFFPSVLSGSQDSVKFTPKNPDNKHAHEYGAYIQDDWEITSKLKLNYGLRLTGFNQVGPYTLYKLDDNLNRIDSTYYGANKTVKWYGGIEPRVTLRYNVKEDESIKLAITRNTQYIHLVSNSGTTLPTDIWVPSTTVVKPQISWQYAAGYFKNILKGMVETSVEVYYKNMDNQIEYKQGYTPNSLKDIQEDFVFGRGWSYGTELLINKVKGRWTGWLGYTLSWTKRKFDAINNGEVFNAKYDRRHDLSLTSTYQLNNKWKLSAVFVYATGNALTLPQRFYFVEGAITQEYSKINEYRMSAYHRLDFAATYTPKGQEKKKMKSNFVFGIYNVYNRKNPYFYYFSPEGNLANGGITIQGKQVSLFPIIPSITWNAKW